MHLHRTLPTLTAALLLLNACKPDAPAQPAADAGVTPAQDMAAEPVPTPAADMAAPSAEAAPAKPQPPTPEQIRAAIAARNKHIAQGRKLAADKKFDEAIAAFEEAIKLDPYDARALSELGWVAFQAGKLERAEEATRTSLKFTYDPKVRGATLYNMGRIHEAREQLPEAAAAYAQSLALRDNATVSKRLADLKAKGVEPPAVASQQCGFKRQDGATPEAICKAMAGGEGRRCDDSDIQTYTLDHPRISEAAVFSVEEESEWTAFYYLAVKVDGIWHTDALGYAYNPGAFGVSEEFEVQTLELRELLPGGQEAIFIQTLHNHYDSDLGVNEVSTEDRTVTQIVGLRGEAIDWLFGAVTQTEWARDILLEEEEEAMKAAGIEHDTALPVGERFGSTLSFKAEDGTVTIAKPADKALPRTLSAGSFKLLDDAPRCVSLW